MFIFCRHRTNLPVDGRLVPFCHRLNSPLCSQQVTAENCAASPLSIPTTLNWRRPTRCTDRLHYRSSTRPDPICKPSKSRCRSSSKAATGPFISRLTAQSFTTRWQATGSRRGTSTGIGASHQRLAVPAAVASLPCANNDRRATGQLRLRRPHHSLQPSANVHIHTAGLLRAVQRVSATWIIQHPPPSPVRTVRTPSAPSSQRLTPSTWAARGTPSTSSSGQMIPPRDPSIITKYGWPTGQDDGSLVYTEGEELPPMEGFEVAGRVVRPLWPFCPSRSLRAALQDTGLLQIEARCMNSLAGQPPWQRIRLTACQNCSFKPAEKLRRTGPTAGPPGRPAWPSG